MAIHTAVTSSDRLFLIVDKAPDIRQPGAFCVTGVALAAIHPAADPPPTGAPSKPTPPPSK